MHPGAFAPRADRHLAAGFNDPRRGAQPGRPELRVAHAPAVAVDVVDALAGLVVGRRMQAEGADDGVDLASVDLLVACARPLLREVGTGAVDRFGDARQVPLAW